MSDMHRGHPYRPLPSMVQPVIQNYEITSSLSYSTYHSVLIPDLQYVL